MIVENRDIFSFMNDIQDGSIDLICTDPPYIISKTSGFASGRNKKFSGGAYKTDFGEWDKQELDLDSLLKEFYRILKPSGYCIIFFDVWKLGELKNIALDNKFVQPRVIQFQKTNPVPINSKINYLTNGIEYALTLTKGGMPTFNSSYNNGVFRYSICHGQERTSHPTQKPLDLIEKLISIHSNEGDVVFDGFAGSGTTGVACVHLNRKFLGCEISEEYFKIANQRMTDTQAKTISVKAGIDSFF